MKLGVLALLFHQVWVARGADVSPGIGFFDSTGISRDQESLAPTQLPAPDHVPQGGDSVRIETEMGTITIRLRRDLAPRHCDLFTKLISSGSFEGCVFYRAEPHFVIQGGLRLVSGEVRQNPFGKVPLEFTGDRPGGLKNKRATVTMARWGDPDSGDGEWFINLKDSPNLDRYGDQGWALGFTVFGEVTAGMDIADKISGLPTRPEGSMHMLEPPVEFRATIV